MASFTARWLYVKRCSHCKLMYFGMTTRKGVENYQGSGTEWREHLEMHGAHAIHVTATFFKKSEEMECYRRAVSFSEKHNIVASKKWANLQIEIGTQGTWGAGIPKGSTRSESTRALISGGNYGKSWYHSLETGFATTLYDGDPLIRKLKLTKGMHSDHVFNLRKTPEHAAKIAASNRARKICRKGQGKGIPKDPKSIEKMRQTLIARYASNEIQAHNKGSSQPLIKCTICGTAGGQSVMKRWHFGNCRLQKA